MKIIYLTQKQVALVDDEDFENLNQYRWCAHKGRDGKYYAERSSGKNVSLKMHNVIMNTGDGLIVDHKDGDGLNNQRSNLRVCTRSQNSMNKKGWGASLYKGVSLLQYSTKSKDGQRIFNYKYWQSLIMCQGKRIFLGNFKTEEEAARAYDKVVEQYHGEFAVFNFPVIKEKQIYCNPCVIQNNNFIRVIN